VQQINSALARLVRPLAIFCVLFFLATTFRYAWTRDATDFRNYFTGALLVRRSQPLRAYYDWSWFQREMNRAHIEQLGSYVSQTPLAMVPLLPVSSCDLPTAKHVWLTVTLLLLLSEVWLLSRLTNLNLFHVVLLLFLGYGTLHVNFLFGQYYILLLFLLTAAAFCLLRRADIVAGTLLGLAFGLKLYGAPFFLFLVVQRRLRAASAMLVATICLLLVAIGLFGWRDTVYYATYIFPRSVEGDTIDPYNSLNNTVVTLLRRLLMFEPELNPHPLWSSPATFFFVSIFISLVVLVLSLQAIADDTDLYRSFSFFSMVALTLSPNIGSYTYVIALLPVTLLFARSTGRAKVVVAACYFCLGLPMDSRWSYLFPKLGVSLVLLSLAGHQLRKTMKVWRTLGLVGAAAIAAVMFARLRLAEYQKEPQNTYEHIDNRPGTIYSSSPAIVNSGIVYQALQGDRYVLRWSHSGHLEDYRFKGHVFFPKAANPEGPIHFELLTRGKIIEMSFDLATKTSSSERTVQIGANIPDMFVEQEVPSPNRRWIALTKVVDGRPRVLLKDSAGNVRQIAGGNCANWSPVWELDSSAVVFATDCNRGIGCPTLFRARIPKGETFAVGQGIGVPVAR
jgi:Glycosyltransferase family 87